MKTFVFALTTSLLFSGCVLSRSFSKRGDETNPTNSSIVQLINSEPGRVAKVNPKFVVLTFPFGGVPVAGQPLNVYRNGKKVAELRTTGPQRDINTVADIISGEARENDEVRAD